MLVTQSWIMTHTPWDMGAPGQDKTSILEGPAIMEIGSAGIPALDTVAAVSFFVVVSVCLRA